MIEKILRWAHKKGRAWGGPNQMGSEAAHHSNRPVAVHGRVGESKPTPSIPRSMGTLPNQNLLAFRQWWNTENTVGSCWELLYW